jgi:hypothetical protein
VDIDEIIGFLQSNIKEWIHSDFDYHFTKWKNNRKF